VAYVVDARDDFAADDEGDEKRRVVGHNLLGGVALAGIILTCGSIVYSNMFAPVGDIVAPPPTVTLVTAKPSTMPAANSAAPAVTVVAKQPAAAAPPSLLVAPSFEIALIDAQPIGTPRPFAQSAPLKTVAFALPPRPQQAPQQIAQQAPQPIAQQTAQTLPAPSPRPRPRDIEPTRNPTLAAAAQRGKFALAAAESTPVAAPAPPSMWEKIFGKPETTGSTLAYASADGGVGNDGKPLAARGANDGLTAVYDISARTVYMPDGTRLEAHSGLRDKLDDPRYVHVRMHGATPPGTYDLTPRERLFHGVAALRMTPVGGEGTVHGRTGLLAHTYMLGPNGDSNGCVSFRDYDAFLQAYRNGKVKRLVVVVSGGRSMLASN
jgi:hypothetical protein